MVTVAKWRDGAIAEEYIWGLSSHLKRVSASTVLKVQVEQAGVAFRCSRCRPRQANKLRRTDVFTSSRGNTPPESHPTLSHTGTRS